MNEGKEARNMNKRAAIYRRITELNNKGLKPISIVDVLNREGMFTVRGNHWTIQLYRAFLHNYRVSTGAPKLRKRRQVKAQDTSLPAKIQAVNITAKGDAAVKDAVDLIEMIFASNMSKDRKRRTVSALVAE
ncbi:MAG: hypothetical protein KF767_18090 [Bdellovibrionaceae bacterium]|nr:hypothetical protein [Pseudobdellovibrionaceae bacterium]